MSAHQEIQLGPAASLYLKERLTQGNALSKHVAREVDFSKGRIFTELPEGISASEAHQFRTGGKVQSHSVRQSGMHLVAFNSLSDAAVAAIQRSLSSGLGRVCIFEDSVSLPKDKCLKKSPARVMFFGNEVYHVLSTQQGDRQTIADTIAFAKCASGLIGFVAELPERVRIYSRNFLLSEDDLHGLAENTQTVVCSAYDGEGYLCWQAQEFHTPDPRESRQETWHASR